MANIFIIVWMSIFALGFANMSRVFKIDAGRYDLAWLMALISAAFCWWLIGSVSLWFILLAMEAFGIVLSGDDENKDAIQYINLMANLNNKGISFLGQTKWDETKWNDYNRIKDLQAAIDERVEEDYKGIRHWKSDYDLSFIPTSTPESKRADEIVRYFKNS